MILKDLYLYPDLVEYPDDVTQPFRDQSRSVCHYLGRYIKPLKYHCEGFNRICFVGTNGKPDENTVNTSGVLTVPIELSLDQYQRSKDSSSALNEYFSTLLLDGIESANRTHDIPADALRAGLDSFREEGFRNDWTFKLRSAMKRSLTCRVDCQLTTETFTAYVRIFKKEQCVFENQIIQTAPDEIAFVPMLKDIIIADNQLSVVDKSERVIYTRSLNDLV